MHKSRSYTTPGKEYGVAMGPMITSGSIRSGQGSDLAQSGGSSEFSHGNNQCVVKKTSCMEVFLECRKSLIGVWKQGLGQ